MQFIGRVTIFVALALCGCPPPIEGDVPGDTDTITSTGTTTNGMTTDGTGSSTGGSSGTDVPTSTGEPVPGVCGDGIVNLEDRVLVC